MASERPNAKNVPPVSRGRHDYEALGFQCGLEIHQQLATGKLFCRCASDVIDVDRVDELTEFTLERRLRPTASELGEMDPAAAAEARRGLRFRYRGIKGHSCLVDADEEPPHDADEDAIDIALTFAALLEARPVDEVQVMRKIVIDGSNTSGFQRTALVALGGVVNDVPIWTVAVEEDSCRKLDKDEEGVVNYTLDRLGIPLIEVATGPQIRDARHAQETAARLGALLRATGRVRRGLGTIRQDLNVSIRGGDRVEIKGVQDLRSVPRVIDAEIDRQLRMIEIRQTLEERGVTADQVRSAEIVDVTDTLAQSTSKVIAGALKRKGRVLGLRLPGFSGLIGGATTDGPRLGREFAGYAKADAGVRGVFHNDEMPAYGITADEAAAVGAALSLGETDGYVLAAERDTVARRALEAVRERAAVALERVPREVRNAQQDDSTTFMRPLPGAARMYPETDVRPTPVSADRWADVTGRLPELPEEAMKRLADRHGLSPELSKQLVNEDHVVVFDAVVARVPRPAELARLILQQLPELEADGVDVTTLAGNVDALVALLGALEQGRFAKEALPQVAGAYCKRPDGGIDAAIEAAGATAVDETEVTRIIADIVADRAELVRERGKGAMGPLMGVVMGELRGKADGALVSKVLAQEIAKLDA